jgi:O-acetylhomoserine/O-acetylserine sulfhydrylase-like pyridoxal-dependent enzyme
MPWRWPLWLERRPDVLSVNDAGLVRHSVGIKARRDILADLDLGFEAIGG